jgi:hypothetical protein
MFAKVFCILLVITTLKGFFAIKSANHNHPYQYLKQELNKQNQVEQNLNRLMQADFMDSEAAFECSGHSHLHYVDGHYIRHCH